ncbi:MAG: phage tail sheath subtilisin-like domain-containing protein [Candidatus Pacebacteria bacterium]|nr:phage tail sheath subtilisin-like domain-containing protein [Candidatus Paceibacterota bacterium]
MGFLVSPGVHVREIDLTNVVPAVATSIGAVAGPFQKGPVSSVTSIGSEEELVQIFGKPNGSNFEWWFTAANFLQYGDQLRVVRAESGILNAGADSGILIRDDEHYLDSFASGEGSHGEWAARSAGTWGNSLRVEMCPTATSYEQLLTGSNQVNDASASAGDTSITVDNADEAGWAFNVGDLISFYSDSTGLVTIDNWNEYEVTAINTGTNVLTIRLKDDPQGRGLQTDIADNSYIRRRWKYYDLFSGAPGTSAWASEARAANNNDELHIVIADATGALTGYDNDLVGNRTKGVLEVWENLSKNPVAKTAQGGSNYYPDVIHKGSNYIYWTDHISGGSNWGTDTTAAYTSVIPMTIDTLTGGTDDYSVTAAELETAYDKFADVEALDINLILGGPSSGVADTKAGQDTFVTMITALVEERKDCVGFVSPYRAATVGVALANQQCSNVQIAYDLCPSSSYMVYDSGHKYMYDKYNDVYRHVPLNGDIGGLCAYTDGVADPWWSPAGYNRGAVRGAIKLSFSPEKADRDKLYRARVNPVVDFPGQGVTLFGDKTALTKPSAFDRINVRRLFLVLEKAIATAAKYMLFEFNDEFTRAQFKNMVEPFLRDVQGRRGIYDFKVVCDSTNNTGEVIDRNEFIGDIYIKPARSINFITLNFIAVRTGVSFSEVGG